MIFMNSSSWSGSLPATDNQMQEEGCVVGKRQRQWDIALARVEATPFRGAKLISFDIAGGSGHQVSQGDESPQDRRDGLGPITVTCRVW
jgi:hypothetical protein